MTSICTYLRSKQNGSRKRNSRNNYSCWNASFLNRLGITHELKGTENYFYNTFKIFYKNIIKIFYMIVLYF